MKKSTKKVVKLKDFDLLIGDVVFAEDEIIGERCSWEVIGIYPSIFQVKRLNSDYKRSYRKVDYQLGNIKKFKII